MRALVSLLVVSMVVGCMSRGGRPSRGGASSGEPSDEMPVPPEEPTREDGDAGIGWTGDEDAGAHQEPPPEPAPSEDAGPRCGTFTECDDVGGRVCVDLANDASHCGECGRECADGLVCSEGRCGCPSGTMLCPGLGCVDLTSDEFSCGACGNECGINSTCESGRCTCAPGFTVCGGTCVDFTDDERNCGGCGVTCGFGQLCTAGRCGGAVCPTGDVCSPVADSGCGTTSGNSCYLTNEGAGCWPRRTGAEGAACTYANDCRSGLSCMDGACRRMCCGDSDAPCGAGRTCMPAGDGYGYCRPDELCDPVRQRGCPIGDGCYSFGEITLCIEPGAAREGEPCNYVQDCATGLDCDDAADGSGICRQYCDLGASSCPSGRTCTPMSYDSARPWLGICL